MSEDHTERTARALEEIRDLLKERNRQEQARMLAGRRLFLGVGAILLVFAIGWFVYAFWTAPQAQDRIERQMDDWLKMQSNTLSQPR